MHTLRRLPLGHGSSYGLLVHAVPGNPTRTHPSAPHPSPPCPMSRTQLTNFLLHGKGRSNESLEVFLLDKCER
jgi:hypothetical protein